MFLLTVININLKKVINITQQHQREPKAIDCPWRVNITWPETALKIKLVSFIIMNLPLIQLTAQLIKIKAMFNLIKEINC